MGTVPGDSRDVIADGLTAGSMGRPAFRNVASGSRQQSHAPRAVTLSSAGKPTVRSGHEHQSTSDS
eukprot:6057933-Pyramimonas_sp.AAC.1